MALADYQELLGKVRGTQLVYLEDMSGDDGDDDYLDRHVADDDAQPAGACCRTSACARRWSTAIKNLPEREQYVMSMYYEHDMNLKEIAAVLERHRVARLPAAQPVDRAAARQAARVVDGQGEGGASIGA